MAQVLVGAVTSYWTTSRQENAVIHKATSAQKKGYQYTPSYQMAAWDGFVKYFSPVSRTLPSGLVTTAVSALEDAGFPVHVQYTDAPPLLPREGAELYFDIEAEHQLRILEAMCEKRRGIIHAATNAGKTKIAEAWCALHKLKILYLVPSKELLRQTVESFQRDTNLDVGYISAEEGWVLGKDVTVCLVTSIAKRESKKKAKSKKPEVEKKTKPKEESASDRFRKIAPQFEAVIVDECHHSLAKTWQKILKQLTTAHYRFGLSGSPWEHECDADRLRVQAYLGPVISEVKNAELIEKEWSAKPTIYMIPVPIFGFVQEKLVYEKAYERGILQCPVRNSLIVQICEDFQKQKESCLVISERIEQCELLSTMLKLNDVDHRLILGRTSREERIQFLEEFKLKKYPVLISNVLSEGVNIPDLNGLIFASGGKGSKQILQRVGRGLRKKLEGENIVKIFDFLDEHYEKLKFHAQDRMAHYTRENFQIEFLKLR